MINVDILEGKDKKIIILPVLLECTDTGDLALGFSWNDVKRTTVKSVILTNEASAKAGEVFVWDIDDSDWIITDKHVVINNQR